MPTRIALLRGINVGGRNRVAMADLKSLLGDLGFTGARSVLQSGNLIFDGGNAIDAVLERTLEAATAKQFGMQADYFVRTPAEWTDLIAANPFPADAERDPSHLVVMLFQSPPEPAAVGRLELAVKGPEIVRAVGRQLYVVYPAGIGTSKLTSAVIEKTIGQRGTARNWNTVLKLAEISRTI